MHSPYNRQITTSLDARSLRAEIARLEKLDLADLLIRWRLDLARRQLHEIESRGVQ